MNLDGDGVFDEFSDLVRDVINEMGYTVEETELQEIEKDSNRSKMKNEHWSKNWDALGGFIDLRLIEDNADVVDSQLFSCLFDKMDDFPSFISDPEQSLQRLTENVEATRHSIRKQVKIPHEFDELINHGYERLQEVYGDIKRYERLVEEMNGKNKKIVNETDGNNENAEPDWNTEGSSQNSQKVQTTSTKSRNADGIANARAVATLGKLDPREETRMLNQFLKKNALRKTQCPKPGRLPFTHDGRLKLEQYRSEWTKNPPPGEQKRMALRWRIRELMTRRDIPHLRILTTEYPEEVEDEDRLHRDD